MTSRDKLIMNPYFNQLKDNHIVCLLESSQELEHQSGEYIFHRDDYLTHFFLVIQGEYEAILETQEVKVEYETFLQPSQVTQETIVLSTIGEGEIFGWSGLVHPFNATSCVRAKNDANSVSFDCKKLLACFDEDCKFGLLMLHTAAVVIGKRLQDTYRGGY